MESMIFGRTFANRFAVCYRTIVMCVCVSCNVGVLWPNSWMDQDAACHGGRSQPRPHCVRWGPSSPQKEGSSPHFHGLRMGSPCPSWPNGWMYQDATWYGGRPQPMGRCQMGTQPLLERAQQPPPFPHFSAHFALAWSPISATTELWFSCYVQLEYKKARLLPKSALDSASVLVLCF